MKRSKIIAIVLGVVTMVSICGYTFAIQGAKTDKDISWIAGGTPIAHRGLDNGDVPENSMMAFKEAIDKKYAIELDIQKTKDNVLVVFHDENLERITGDKRDIAEVDYDELKKLRIEETDEVIPTLDEVIKLVDGQVPLLIEIKNGENAKELAIKTYEIMKDYEGDYAMQSFNPFILEWYAQNAPEVIRCQLASNFEGDKGRGLKSYEKIILKNLLLNFKSKPHVLAYDLESEENLSTKLFKKNYPMISWTIRNDEDMKRALERSDNIIFDNILP